MRGTNTDFLPDRVAAPIILWKKVSKFGNSYLSLRKQASALLPDNIFRGSK